MSQAHSFVPALGFDWLTRFYDPFVGLLLRERTLKQRLIDQAGIKPGQEVLDLGCGTGTLAIMVKQACPGARKAAHADDPPFYSLERVRKPVTPRVRSALEDAVRVP